MRCGQSWGCNFNNPREVPSSPFFPQTGRENLKHNYNVLKGNAKNNANTRQISLGFEMQERANVFRKGIHEEGKRLIVDKQ